MRTLTRIEQSGLGCRVLKGHGITATEVGPGWWRIDGDGYPYTAQQSVVFDMLGAVAPRERLVMERYQPD